MIPEVERVQARWVGASSESGWVTHAVWVTHDTPLVQRTHRFSNGLELTLNEPDTRAGISACGVRVPSIVAGSNGGHDWDRVSNSKRCLNCVRELDR